MLFVESMIKLQCTTGTYLDLRRFFIYFRHSYKKMHKFIEDSHCIFKIIYKCILENSNKKKIHLQRQNKNHLDLLRVQKKFGMIT